MTAGVSVTMDGVEPLLVPGLVDEVAAALAMDE